MDFLPIRRALLSVTDKSLLVEFATFLAQNQVELVSTGGTRRMLAEAELPVTPVSDVTGFPEILGGRVKTLHPNVHGGVLADKDNPEHLETLQQHEIKPFDLICVNLYNFADAAKKELDLKQAVEEIDIGGPTMLRAAAKNFHSILVVPGVSHYTAIMDEMRANKGKVGLDLRRRLAAETFGMVSEYDRMISAYLTDHTA
ncbi:phosphoribosylaminoimidazolecarboxamide formyltransferase / IMP cyclohydrolase [Paucidesulfovibrio gracilis DSM 16080]|uniref:Phosphoribosylaminoimidazolecarboxamide formyltransferase / IMP cyclohydrolase n=1 Tax=Paucidesulfovibrio gracilis DSM 16080 TaxID=1121449 RepID=A0A1T4W0P0_9BACT|nr:IMP cyclohydrolase [Paucidesulfovibrio gracilis]SKA70816.1 phosphoribosylaminoimidazolecarboxamide formyltransferase / IMP cyclohydrolase [Paucidesulfovibrio gracilis DSM 16080]